MKKTFFVILIAVTLLLCACADASVSYSIGSDDNVDIEYKLVIKSVELDARNYADSVAEYWRSQRFNTDISLDEENVTVSGHKAVLLKDRQSAADAFANTVAGQQSVFSSVDFNYSPSFEEDIYSFSAMVSLEDIIRQSELQDIPENELDELLSQAQSGNYTLSVCLPGVVTETNADINVDGVCSWKLEYGKEKQISLNTRLDNTANIDEYADVTDRLNSTVMLLKLMIVAASSIILAIIIIIVLKAVKRSKDQKSL